MSKDIYNLASECPLRPAAKAVLQQLAWYAHDDGKEAYPSVITIARRTGLKRRTVQKVLRELEAQQIIYAVGSRLGGRRHTTHYAINIRKLQEIEESANRIHPLGRHKGEPEDQERATVTHAMGELQSPDHQEHEKEKKSAPYDVQVLRAQTKSLAKSKSLSPQTNEDWERRRQFLKRQSDYVQRQQTGQLNEGELPPCANGEA